VIGAHAESYGAMGQLAVDGLLECLSTPDPPERLADYWLAVKKGIANGKMDRLTFWLYDQADGSRGKTSLDLQCKEHLEMWMLLGDPAMRLPVVRPTIELTTKDTAAAGKTVTVNGTLPARFARSAVRVTLERPTGSSPPALVPLPQDPAARRRVMLANHERANALELASVEAAPRDGRFEATLKLPAETPWPRVIVRAVAAGEGDVAMGVLTLPLKK
jgi:hypothetical protein